MGVELVQRVAAWDCGNRRTNAVCDSMTATLVRNPATTDGGCADAMDEVGMDEVGQVAPIHTGAVQISNYMSRSNWKTSKRKSHLTSEVSKAQVRPRGKCGSAAAATRAFSLAVVRDSFVRIECLSFGSEPRILVGLSSPPPVGGGC